MPPPTHLRALIALAALGITGATAQSGAALPPPTYGWNYSPTDRDNEAVSRNYQDVDVQLLSPAFLYPSTVPDGFSNGTAGPTNDTVMDGFLRSIADRNDWCNYHLADFTSEQGRPIPYMFLTAASQPGGAMAVSDNSTKLRVYIQGAIHGNEPAGDQGIMALLGKMDANQTWTAALLERMDVLVLPRYNPDGVAYFQRQYSANVDPNREGTKLAKRQSRDIRRLVSRFDPHMVVDMHEYAGNNVYGGIYRHGQDAMIASGRNLNTHAAIRNMTETLFVAGVGRRLESRGLRWEPYVLGPTSNKIGTPIIFEEAVTSPTSGRNAWGLTQAIVLLFELRGQWLADQHFQRRTASALTMLEAALDLALANADDVLATMDESVAEFVSGDRDIVLSDYPQDVNRTFTMVDVRDGGIVQVPVLFRSSTPTLANLTRPRPRAYLIPPTWRELAERLEVSGVEVRRLGHAFRGPVRAYNITSAALDGAWYEGTVRNRVTTEAYEKDLELPAGAFLVSARQKNAALAYVTLEPESDVSFVTFGMIPVSTGMEYPIWRIESWH